LEKVKLNLTGLMLESFKQGSKKEEAAVFIDLDYDGLK
jgi:hypothetical protein